MNEEMAKVQLELNLQIAELQLNTQPSTPPEVREQCASTITIGIEDISSAVKDCTKLFEESFEVLTTLEEDPNIQHLEIEVHELQQKYDGRKGTAPMMALTQRLVWMQQEKALKEQVDAVQHKEAVLRVYLQPWIDEAFIIIGSIEAKLM